MKHPKVIQRSAYSWYLQVPEAHHFLFALDTSGSDSDSDSDITIQQGNCKHDITDLKPLDGAYFNNSYLKNMTMTHFPHNCATCPEATFIGEDATYKPSFKNLVYACTNATDQFHECMFCLCKPCYNKELCAPTKKDRVRRHQCQIMPGEKAVVDKDGAVIVMAS